MPSFFDFMQRMFEGKPVFDNQDSDSKKPDAGYDTRPSDQQQATQPSAPAEQPRSTIVKGQHHTFPVIEVKRVESRIEPKRLKVYGWLENTWNDEIMLDKIRLLHATRELDASLRSHEQKQLLLYDGPRPAHQEFEAEIDYKTYHDGDYFRGVYLVGFEYHQEDKTYSVDGLHLHEPVRDIYE